MSAVTRLADAMEAEIAWYRERITFDKVNRSMWERNLRATIEAHDRLSQAIAADAQKE